MTIEIKKEKSLEFKSIVGSNNLQKLFSFKWIELHIISKPSLYKKLMIFSISQKYSTLIPSFWKIKKLLLKFKNQFVVWEKKKPNIFKHFRWYTNMEKNSMTFYLCCQKHNFSLSINKNRCKHKKKLIILLTFLI